MRRITEQSEIVSAYAKFVGDGDGPYGTGTVPQGLWAKENLEFWAERGTIDGWEAIVYSTFEKHETEVDHVDFIPFNLAHVDYIEINDDEEDEEDEEG